jgi:hypothetical protein
MSPVLSALGASMPKTWRRQADESAIMLSGGEMQFSGA